MPEELPVEIRDARREVAKIASDRSAFLRSAARSGVVDHLELSRIDGSIAALLDGIAALVDPCDAREDVPLVLLPVRVETRFAKDGRRTVLKVRIYPDEIHMDALVRGLSAEEIAAGHAYWTAVWSEPVGEGAWDHFVATVGAGRAEWVAFVTTPTNLAERSVANVPTFPTVDQRAPRNVVARALPDRFVVIADQGGRRSRSVGRPVARDLAMSPIPLEGDQPERVRDALTVPPGSEWLIDFATAEDKGMAVTLPLTGGTATIDRLVVVGTRASSTPAASAAEIEDLFVGHRFADGFALLGQGVPTNNADGERSPYRRRRQPVEPSLVAPVASGDSDTAALAAQLGIDANVLTGLVGDGTGEQRVARHVNTALWNPGWGSYLDRLDAQGVPGVVDAQRESARQLFRDQVRGRGVAPTIHVGAQPYGVVPVSNLATWVPRAGESTAGIVAVVRTLLPRWLVAAARRVPTVRAGTSRIDDTLLGVLGSSPVMQGLRVRPVLSDDVSAAMLAALGIDHREFEAEKMSMAAPLFALLASDAYKAAIGSLHAETRPLPLPLASDRDGEFMTALLTPGASVPAIDSVLQALAALAWRSSELDVAKAAPATILPDLLGMIELEPRLRERVASTVAGADTMPPGDLFELVGSMKSAGVSAATASTLRTYEPIEVLQTSIGQVALASPTSQPSRALAAEAVAGWLVAMGYRNEVRDALSALGTESTPARALAVAEALDCSSHRLDAWATAVVADRRSRQTSVGQRGLTIGAYGIVEQLSPASGSGADGWIHAPTTRHAIAAGMLRSSHLSHLPTSGPAAAGGPFAVDLSSARLQSATHVIQGVRSGQPLGALIGYRIERELAAARLARLHMSLRTIAPLVAGRLSDSTGDDTATVESVAANNVVDGVLLLQRHPPGDLTLRARLDQVPVNPYLDPGDWEPLTDAQWNTVTRVLTKAADTIDAVADVLLSEAVMQYAGGNATRAAAAMDSMSTGAAPADTLDILESQDSGERLTHRALVVVAADAPATTWNAARPRAIVEPLLEAWAARQLGDPSTIVVADDGAGTIVTLDNAGCCALDVVFAPDVATLERMVRGAIPKVGMMPLAVRRDPAWDPSLRALGQVVALATAMREMIAGGHALRPSDLARPGTTPTRTVDVTDLLDRLDQMVGNLEATIAACVSAVNLLSTDDLVDTLDDAAAVTAQMAPLSAFALPPELPGTRPLDMRWVRSTWETADARAVAARAAWDACRLATGDGTPEHLVVEQIQDAVAIVFGDGFAVVPRLLPGAAADDVTVESGSPSFAAPARGDVARFVADLSTVRPQVRRLADVHLLARAVTGGPSDLRVVQLGERLADGTPAPGTDRWLAGPLPAAGPWPSSPVAHLVVDGLGTIKDVVAGLVVDGWVEDVPVQIGVNADPLDLRPQRARTGLAVRANSASARPPQAILCAVSPDGRRWTADSLWDLLEQTMQLASARLVTLERLAGDAVALPALYVRSSSLQGESYLDFTGLAALNSSFVSMKYVTEAGS